MSESAAAAPAHVIPEWSLGDRLRKVRRLLGLSQIEFAEQLGTNTKTYAAWELDSTAPRNSVTIAKRVEVLSGVPATWILGFEKSSPTRWYRPTERHLVALPALLNDADRHVEPDTIGLDPAFALAPAEVPEETHGQTNQFTRVA